MKGKYFTMLSIDIARKEFYCIVNMRFGIFFPLKFCLEIQNKLNED